MEMLMSKQWPDWSNEEEALKKSVKVKLQATDQELFGHLVKSEEELKKAEEDYNNKLNKWFEEANKNIDNKESDWANGKSFNSTLTEQERLSRNMYLGGGDSDI